MVVAQKLVGFLGDFRPGRRKHVAHVQLLDSNAFRSVHEYLPFRVQDGQDMTWMEPGNELRRRKDAVFLARVHLAVKCHLGVVLKPRPDNSKQADKGADGDNLSPKKHQWRLGLASLAPMA